MPEGDSSSAQGSATARADHTSEDEGGGRLWQGLRALLFGDEEAQSLREQIEAAIDEHEKEAGPLNPANDLSAVERTMLRNLLHFSEHDVDDIAVPRSDIVAVAKNASLEELVALFAEHGHSRMPVYGESLDELVGMVHIRDVFAIIAGNTPPMQDWSSLIRQPLYAPQSMGVLDLLAAMRQHRTHLAIVVDEYSGTDGLVTIEDLVEQIVGQIEDEHDDEPTELLVPLGDGMWDADARVTLDEVAERVDERLGEVDEDVDTLGGLAFVLAEQVPEPGKVIEHGSGWKLEVIDGDERRVTRIRLHAPSREETVQA